MTNPPVLDLRHVPCPINWIRAKVILEETPPDQFLSLLLDDPTALQSVKRTLERDGYRITSQENVENYFKITVQKI